MKTVSTFTRQSAQLDNSFTYIFGDNTQDRLHTKHIPKYTQAVIRGLSNAVGIDTKKNRFTSQQSFFTNDDLFIFKANVERAIGEIKSIGKPVAIPSNGIGTGKAMLKQKAPLLFDYLSKRLMEEFGFKQY